MVGRAKRVVDRYREEDAYYWSLVMVSLVVGRVRTTYKYRGVQGDEGTGDAASGVGTKWGDRDNDNVRSALAGGLLRLMDALIISKQELQCFAYPSAYADDDYAFPIETIVKKEITRRTESQDEKKNTRKIVNCMDVVW